MTRCSTYITDFIVFILIFGPSCNKHVCFFSCSIQECALINQYMRQLATKFPYTKFIKAIAQTCIPNFPERNLPSVFVYFEGDMKKQFIGATELRGTSLTLDGRFQWSLNATGFVWEIREIFDR